MSRKTVYYHDPLHDDFAPTNGHIRPKPIGTDFPYEHPSPIWQAFAFVVYRLIMTPFLFLYCKLVFGLRIENRKALRGLPGGCFLYGNHTNTLADAFIRRCWHFRAGQTSSPQRIRSPFRACATSCRCSAPFRWPTQSTARGSFSPRCTGGWSAVRPL